MRLNLGSKKICNPKRANFGIWLVILLAAGLLVNTACRGGSQSSIVVQNTAVLATKVPDPQPFVVNFPTGYEFLLPEGISDALRARLGDGAAVYSILAFEAPLDETLRAQFTADGLDLLYELGGAIYVARVSPQALASLQEIEQTGFLHGVVVYPVEAKITPAMTQKLFSAAPEELLNVEVQLFAEPTPEERAILTQWLQIRAESPGAVYLLSGEIENQNIDKLIMQSIVRAVAETQ